MRAIILAFSDGVLYPFVFLARYCNFYARGELKKQISWRGSLNLGNRLVTIDQAESSISSFPKGGAQNPFDIYRRA